MAKRLTLKERLQKSEDRIDRLEYELIRRQYKIDKLEEELKKLGKPQEEDLPYVEKQLIKVDFYSESVSCSFVDYKGNKTHNLGLNSSVSISAVIKHLKERMKYIKWKKRITLDCECFNELLTVEIDDDDSCY